MPGGPGQPGQQGPKGDKGDQGPAGAQGKAGGPLAGVAVAADGTLLSYFNGYGCAPIVSQPPSPPFSDGTYHIFFPCVRFDETNSIVDASLTALAYAYLEDNVSHPRAARSLQSDGHQPPRLQNPHLWIAAAVQSLAIFRIAFQRPMSRQAAPRSSRTYWGVPGQTTAVRSGRARLRDQILPLWPSISSSHISSTGPCQPSPNVPADGSNLLVGERGARTGGGCRPGSTTVESPSRGPRQPACRRWRAL
jgi:hypothetical protein